MAAVHLSKRSALNKCPACRFVYILLCSKIYATAPEGLGVLNDLRTKTTQDRSVELRKPFFGNQVSMNFPFFIGKLVFCFYFLDLIAKPFFVRERNSFARVTD